jgi:PAS domain S-box-containing protein
LILVLFLYVSSLSLEPLSKLINKSAEDSFEKSSLCDHFDIYHMQTIHMKRQASFTVDDPTYKSDNTDSYFFKPERFDVLPLVLTVIIVVISLTSALTSFFLLKRNETYNAQQSLNATAYNVAAAYTTALASVELWVQMAASYWNLTDSPLTLRGEFVPFMYTTGQFPTFLSTISFSARVPYEQQDAWLQYMRTQGPDYVNMTINARDANNLPIPAPYSAVRYVVTQIIPTVNMNIVVGYDMTSDQAKNDTLQRAIALRSTAASSRMLIVNQIGKEYVGIFIMHGVYNSTNGDPIGLISGSMLVDQLTNAAILPIAQNLYVSVFDLNTTASDPYQGFVYSTAPPSGNNTVITTQQNNDLINAAMFTFSQPVHFSDRVFKVVLIPTNDYLASFDTYIKYLALIVSLGFMLLLLIGCVFLYLVRKLMRARQAKTAANIQIDLLSTNQTALRGLLDRIATQEQKARATINALPDSVCVINHEGKIIQMNQAFDKEFPFSQQELEKGIYTWSIFTELASDFYHEVHETDITTQAVHRFGGSIEVQLRVRSIENNSNSTFTSLSNGLNGSQSMVQNPEKECYVIIVRNMNKNHAHDDGGANLCNALEKQYRTDVTIRKEIRALCENEKCFENIMFLDSICEYKKASFGPRIEMKQQIFDKFIRYNVSHQLNLSNEMIIEESIKITKSMGDIEVFKHIKDAVFNMLYNVYTRNNLPRSQSIIETITELKLKSLI